MDKVLEIVFSESADMFLERENENILSGVAERNLCSRLAIYLTNLLEKHSINGYYADSEYNRNKGGKVKTILDNNLTVVTIQCDLIVHSRGSNTQQDNLIAIEMKKIHRPESEKENDRNRLRALTKDSYDDVWSYDGVTLPEHICRYIIGIYMILDINARVCYFEYYKKGEKIGERKQAF